MREKAGHLNSGDFPLDLRHRVRPKRDPYDALRPWSAITHGVGAGAAAVCTFLLLLGAWRQGDGVKGLVFGIYGASMFCLYLASTLYHQVNTTAAKRVALRKYDHCSIYLLIAGSYTPICIVGMERGVPLLAVIWSLGVAGVILTLAKLEIPRWLASAIYLAMGWMALFVIVPISRSLPAEGFFWLLAGGVLYTIGGVLYAVKWPGRNNPRFGCHEIFHVFILMGSACHFLLMYRVIARM